MLVSSFTYPQILQHRKIVLTKQKGKKFMMRSRESKLVTTIMRI